MVFLSLLSAAMAAPQVYNPYYGTYGMYGYPSYGYPMVQSPMATYPRLGYPAAYPISYPGMISSQAGPAATRGVVKLGNFLEINGKMEESTANSLTVKGEFTIQQNGLFDLFSNGDAKFNAYVMSSTDLTGTNVYVKLGTGADCATAITNAATAAVSNNPKYFLYITGNLFRPWLWSTLRSPSMDSTSPATPRTTASAAPPPARPT